LNDVVEDIRGIADCPIDCDSATGAIWEAALGRRGEQSKSLDIAVGGNFGADANVPLLERLTRSPSDSFLLNVSAAGRRLSVRERRLPDRVRLAQTQIGITLILIDHLAKLSQR